MIAGILLTSPVASWAKSTVAVGVHGVNYSNETFSFSLVDPETEKPSGAGEMVDRFSAGGTVCCYSLPEKWRPGIKVQIDSRHWLKKDAAGRLPEIVEKHIVEVPAYVDDEPGDLWVLRRQDGTYAVVSSQYRPDHEKWPDRIKGWPVPSQEYRRELILLEISLAEDDLKSSERTSKKINGDPAAYARSMWDFWKTSKTRDVSKFSGPDDPALHASLKEDIFNRVQYRKEKLRALQNMQP